MPDPEAFIRPDPSGSGRGPDDDPIRAWGNVPSGKGGGL